MNTSPRAILTTCLAVTALTLAGCSKKQPVVAEKAAPPPPPQPTTVPITTGRIALADMPETDLSTVEVIVLPKLTPELIMLLDGQHNCYSDLLAPLEPEGAEDESSATQEEASSDGLELLSERDRGRLEDMLNELKEKVPPRMKSSFTVNSDMRDFESRESLYDRYKKPISALTLENMVEYLNKIGEMMRSDYDLLVQETESSNEGRVLQARADINWMAAFSEYMEDYQRLVRRYDSLRRRAILRANRSGSTYSSSSSSSGESPEQAFERFQLDNAMNLQVVCYKDALGTAFAQPDGTFEVKGHGILLARIDDEHIRPVFFRQGMQPPTITFEDLNQSEKTVQPEAGGN